MWGSSMGLVTSKYVVIEVLEEGLGRERRFDVKRVDLGRGDGEDRGWWRRKKREKSRREGGEGAMNGWWFSGCGVDCEIGRAHV